MCDITIFPKDFFGFLFSTPAIQNTEFMNLPAYSKFSLSFRTYMIIWLRTSLHNHDIVCSIQ